MANDDKVAISKRIVWSVLSVLISALFSISWLHLNYRLNSNTADNTRQDKQIVQNQVAIGKTLVEVQNSNKIIALLIKKVR